jgi:hypothetical protein
MKNITYLIGAGASANALPILSKITERIDIFIEELKESRHNINVGLHTELNELLQSLQWLQRETRQHQTIDTYARKLFSRTEWHGDLHRLKSVLSTYFGYEQVQCGKNMAHPNGLNESKHLPDKRYDSFIATLLPNRVNDSVLKGNIKVLTWNYDVQLEMAYKRFAGLDTLRQTHEKIQVVPGKWIVGKQGQKIDHNNFSLIHLNGVAGFWNILEDKEDTVIDICASETSSPTILTEIIKYYGKISAATGDGHEGEGISYLNYSWEYLADGYIHPNPLCNTAIRNAIDVAAKTNILVVIGYSFPPFNRTVDKMIIEQMTGLQRIYVQDKEPEKIATILKHGFPRVHEMVFGRGESLISTTNNLDQFVLPYEIWD